MYIIISIIAAILLIGLIWYNFNIPIRNTVIDIQNIIIDIQNGVGNFSHITTGQDISEIQKIPKIKEDSKNTQCTSMKCKDPRKYQMLMDMEERNARQSQMDYAQHQRELQQRSENIRNCGNPNYGC